MKTKLDLNLAAHATALKCRETNSQREAAAVILDDFSKTGLADKHYGEFDLLVNEKMYQFIALDKVLIDPVIEQSSQQPN